MLGFRIKVNGWKNVEEARKVRAVGPGHLATCSESLMSKSCDLLYSLRVLVPHLPSSKPPFLLPHTSSIQHGSIVCAAL